VTAVSRDFAVTCTSSYRTTGQ